MVQLNHSVSTGTNDKAGSVVKKHKDGILKWFQTKMTNGLLEGINGLHQAAKWKVRGYLSPDNFIVLIYATVNKLNLMES